MTRSRRAGRRDYGSGLCVRLEPVGGPLARAAEATPHKACAAHWSPRDDRTTSIPRQDVLPRSAVVGEAKILHQHDLGRREAIVYLGERKLADRMINTSLQVRV